MRSLELPHAVYVLVDETFNRVIYVGLSRDPAVRERTHRRLLEPSFELVVLARFASRLQAHTFEAALIREMKPVLNGEYGAEQYAAWRKARMSEPTPGPTMGGPKEILWQPGEWQPRRRKGAAA
jgi:predicted GIY-YIG superfamily endonuclease